MKLAIKRTSLNILKKHVIGTTRSGCLDLAHRVYKNFDPRAKVLRKACHDVLGKLGVHDPLLELAMELERIAIEDSYFIEKKLYPNVDFYSGIILKARGSQPLCSPCCLRWRAQPAGLHNGMK